MSGLPANQRNDSKYLRSNGAVGAAEGLMYKAAASLNHADKANEEEAWGNSQESLPQLYRAIRSLKLPTTQRVVSTAAGEDVRGQCFGITASSCGAPRVAPSSRKVVDIVKVVAASIKEADPTFTFTSLQIILGARAQWHVDQANCGPSMAMALGPYRGGQLMVYDKEKHDQAVLGGGCWNSFDGRDPHCVMPFSGQRAAIVAFTHYAA